ncbi:MAG: MBL fold metallo-hydrolase, partial [Bacteroidales bacterium]|nr:MBL fold metallo-hydrolase [Bacteroidales bacterium]
LISIDNTPFFVEGIEVIPIRAYHYTLPILGFRIGDIAYLTDANRIPDEEFEKLHGVKVFVINSVKLTPHISHFSLPEALDVIKRVGAERSFITHISHQLPPYTKMLSMLPQGVEPAYDMLSVEI